MAKKKQKREAALPLTVKRIAKLLQQPGRHRDGGSVGLYLQVSENGRGSWLFRYERGGAADTRGRERMMGLGRLLDYGLQEARQRAQDLRRQLDAGIDPLAAKRAARASAAVAQAQHRTFREVADRYYDKQAPGWTNKKHRAQFLSTMRDYVFPKIGHLPVNAIDTALVIAVLEQKLGDEGKLWAARPVTASRVRNRIELVLAFATLHGYREGDNPARWRGHLAQHFPSTAKLNQVAHLAALPFAQISEFFAELRKHPSVPARALEFAILTAARTGEVIGARWDEIDLDAKMWTVPAGRMKASKLHRVPLSAPALALLRALPREDDNPFVFIGSAAGAGLGNGAMEKFLRHHFPQHRATVHGFRSTFRDWAAETTTYANHVIEQALAHAIGSAVEAAYRRGDLIHQRAALMESWAQYCGTPRGATGAVVPMRKRRDAPGRAGR